MSVSGELVVSGCDGHVDVGDKSWRGAKGEGLLSFLIAPPLEKKSEKCLFVQISCKIRTCFFRAKMSPQSWLSSYAYGWTLQLTWSRTLTVVGCTGVLTSWCEELGRLLLVRHQNSRSAAVTSVDCASTQKQVGYVKTLLSSSPASLANVTFETNGVPTLRGKSGIPPPYFHGMKMP